jgi:hypothetical protein
MKRYLSIILSAVILATVAGFAVSQTFVTQQPGSTIVNFKDTSRAPGSTFFVSSGTGTNGTSCGRSPSSPCATVDYAVGRCTANKGDIIYVMPAHVEDGATTTLFDADVAGISIIGLGNEMDRPEFHYNNSADIASIGAANVTLKNLVFVPSVTGITVAVDVEATGDNAVIEGCLFAEGEDGAGTDEFLTSVRITGGAHDVRVVGNEFRNHASAGATQAIYAGLGAASNRLTVEKNVIIGGVTYGLADGATTSLAWRIVGNSILATTPISIQAANTGFISDNAVANEDTGIVAAGLTYGNQRVAGSTFYVKVTVAAGASVVTTGMSLTGASSGLLALDSLVVMVGATALDSSGHAAALAFYSDNAKGTDPFASVLQSALTAQDVWSLLAYTITQDGDTVVKTAYGNGYILESGKILKAKAVTENFTAGGTFNVYAVFRRLTNGATVASR